MLSVARPCDTAGMTKHQKTTPLEQLTAAAAVEKDLAQKMAEARARTAELIAECLSAGIELSAVAAATGLTPSGTRSRLRADPSNPDAWPATRARVEAAAAKRGQPRTRAPLPPAPAGFARMTEAAVALNLSRSGIYYKIDAGELTTKTIDGHRYVKMPKESPKR